jgi:hypothetical protein
MRTTALGAGVALVALLGACVDSPVQPAGSSAEDPLQGRARVEGYPTPGELRTGWIFGRNGQPIQVTFEVHAGRAIFEGDIDIGEAASIPRTREALFRAPQGQVPRLGVVRDGTICPNSPCSSFRWPFGQIFYEIAPNLPNPGRVTAAIAHIEAKNPGVRFFVRQSINPNWIFIAPGGGCSSPVGRQGGRQTISLADGCGTGSTIHEFLHSLGMHHEHSRCDRDAFVEVLWGNIQSGQAHNFTAQCDGYEDVLGYQEASIMHYPTHGFSNNGQPTLRSRRGLDHLMGQRDSMSTTDAETVELMYPRPGLSVYITGPQYIARFQSAQYTANASLGTTPYSFQWRGRDRMTSGNFGPWSPWYSTGSQNYTYASINSCGINAKELETMVTDAASKTATNTYMIFLTNPC